MGDAVEVKVLEIRPEERRMTLSLRQALEEKGDYGDYGGDENRVTLGDVYGDLLNNDVEEEEDEE